MAPVLSQCVSQVGLPLSYTPLANSTLMQACTHALMDPLTVSRLQGESSPRSVQWHDRR